jgi:hypothetical protein
VIPIPGSEVIPLGPNDPEPLKNRANLLVEIGGPQDFRADQAWRKVHLGAVGERFQSI